MNPNIEPCPLCGLAQHPGKCSKPVRGKYWCGICLIERLSPEDLQAPALSPLLLLAAGVERTTKWCMRCGTSLCAHHIHVTPDKPEAHPRCIGTDCRTRPPARVESLRKALEKYCPGYSSGPARCRACGLPAYRRKLCQRHYTQLRKGAVYLIVERQRKYSGHTVKPVGIYLNDQALTLAKELAGVQSLSKWVADVVTAEIKRRTGVDVEHGHIIFTETPN